MNIYFDNAATTATDPEVFDAMRPYMLDVYGNPSSSHEHGRKARAAVETARRHAAALLGCAPGEIIFTSGGTEADNSIITGAVRAFGIRNIITSPIEHHAVTHTVEHLAETEKIALRHVRLDARGNIDINHVEELLKKHPRALVTLMYANNEIGNLLDIRAVGALCLQAGAYFHSDMVQGIGHYPVSLNQLPIHSAAASAHKFHGPKGIGLMYLQKDKKIPPLLLGGGQERGHRSGTENVPGIIGMAKALEIAYRDLEQDRRKILAVKKILIERLRQEIPEIEFYGESANENSLYSLLNVSLPERVATPLLVLQLDIRGISASSGSACSSGATVGSHVIQAIYPDTQRGALRLSFSRYNTLAEAEAAAVAIAEIVAIKR